MHITYLPVLDLLLFIWYLIVMLILHLDYNTFDIIQHSPF